jgi:hypothetical protein
MIQVLVKSIPQGWAFGYITVRFNWVVSFPWILNPNPPTLEEIRRLVK